MPCYSPLQGWKDEETGGIKFNRGNSKETMEVACGQCLGCRLDRSRMWAMRIVHESSLYESTGSNCFVTLTYRDESECDAEQLANGFHVPIDWSLDKSHFRNFMKRLRKFFSPQKIRFYHCGEYGRICRHGFDLERMSCPVCKLGRPHYHACLFNCSFSDLESYGSHNGQLRYTSPTLERIWKYGFVDVGELNFESAAYVARYILKKINGVQAEDHYLSFMDDGTGVYLQPEYTTMSRRPGIGKDWFERYRDDVFPSDEVPVPGSGVFKKVPRYYEELFAITHSLSLEEIKEVRKKFRDEHKEEYTPQRLHDKYRVKQAQVDLLKRTV